MGVYKLVLVCVIFFVLFLDEKCQGAGVNPCGILETPAKIPCDNSQCIIRDNWCNRKPDCDDGSDEKYCREQGWFGPKPDNHCTEKHFVCNNGRCIPHIARCDDYFDCSDDSDEDNCEGMTGPFEISFEYPDTDLPEEYLIQSSPTNTTTSLQRYLSNFVTTTSPPTTSTQALTTKYTASTYTVPALPYRTSASTPEYRRSTITFTDTALPFPYRILTSSSTPQSWTSTAPPMTSEPVETPSVTTIEAGHQPSIPPCTIDHEITEHLQFSMQHKKEEHELRLQHEKQEHEFIMQHNTEQHSVSTQNRREEHDLIQQNRKKEHDLIQQNRKEEHDLIQQNRKEEHDLILQNKKEEHDFILQNKRQEYKLAIEHMRQQHNYFILLAKNRKIY